MPKSPPKEAPETWVTPRHFRLSQKDRQWLDKIIKAERKANSELQAYLLAVMQAQANTTRAFSKKLVKTYLGLLRRYFRHKWTTTIETIATQLGNTTLDQLSQFVNVLDKDQSTHSVILISRGDSWSAMGKLPSERDADESRWFLYDPAASHDLKEGDLHRSAASKAVQPDGSMDPTWTEPPVILIDGLSVDLIKWPASTPAHSAVHCLSFVRHVMATQYANALVCPPTITAAKMLDEFRPLILDEMTANKLIFNMILDR